MNFTELTPSMLPVTKNVKCAHLANNSVQFFIPKNIAEKTLGVKSGDKVALLADSTSTRILIKKSKSYVRGFSLYSTGNYIVFRVTLTAEYKKLISTVKAKIVELPSRKYKDGYMVDVTSTVSQSAL